MANIANNPPFIFDSDDDSDYESHESQESSPPTQYYACAYDGSLFQTNNYEGINFTPNKTERFGVIQGMDHDIQQSIIMDLAKNLESTYLQPEQVMKLVLSRFPMKYDSFFTYYHLDTGIMLHTPGERTIKKYFPGRKHSEVTQYIPEEHKAQYYQHAQKNQNPKNPRQHNYNRHIRHIRSHHVKIRPEMYAIMEYCRGLLQKSRDEVYDEYNTAIRNGEESEHETLRLVTEGNKLIIPVTRRFCEKLRHTTGTIKLTYDKHQREKQALISGFFHGCIYSSGSEHLWKIGSRYSQEGIRRNIAEFVM